MQKWAGVNLKEGHGLQQEVVQSLKNQHHAVLERVRLLSVDVRPGPSVRDALLQMFLVDFEVLRNLSELLSGENSDPEMLGREDPGA